MHPTHPPLCTVSDAAELQALWRVVAEAKFQAAPSDAALWGSPRVHALATNLADAMRRWHQPQGDTAAVEAHHRWIDSLPTNAVLPVQRAQLKKDAASRWWHAMTAAQQRGHVRGCAAPFAVDAVYADFLDALVAEAQSTLPLQSAPPAPRATHDFDTMC